MAAPAQPPAPEPVPFEKPPVPPVPVDQPPAPQQNAPPPQGEKPPWYDVLGRMEYHQRTQPPNALTETAAILGKSLMEGIHGATRFGEEALALPYRAISGDWQSRTPAVLSYVTGKLKDVISKDAARGEEDLGAVPKFLAETMGGIAPYVLTGGVLKAAGLTAEVPAAAGWGAKVLGKLGNNLLTFGITDVSRAVGQGGGAEEAQEAFIHSLPAAAVFTVAEVIPFDKLVKSPWMVKALQTGGTGAAFAGTAAIEGQRDPYQLAVSFLTGAGIHFLTSGLPEKRQKSSVQDMWLQYVKEHGLSEQEAGPAKKIVDQVETAKKPENTPEQISSLLVDHMGRPFGQQEPAPVLSLSGQPMASSEVQAAIAKPSWARNAHEKFLADQAGQQERITTPPAPPPVGEIIPGERGYGPRAQTAESAVDRMQRAADLAGKEGQQAASPMASPGQAAAEARGGAAPPEAQPAEPPKPAPKRSPFGGLAKETAPMGTGVPGAGVESAPEKPPVAPGEAPTEAATTPQTAPEGGAAPQKPGVSGEISAAPTPFEAPAESGGSLPPGAREFMQKFGTARGTRPEGLLTGEGQKKPPKERTAGVNLARVIKGEYPGIDPKYMQDYFDSRAPEERNKLNRTILKKGGIAPDDMFDQLNNDSRYRGYFQDAGDMIQYFLDGRHERELKSFNPDNEKAVAVAEEAHEQRRLALNDDEWNQYKKLSAESFEQAEAWLNERSRNKAAEYEFSPEEIAGVDRTAESELAAEEAQREGGPPGEAGPDTALKQPDDPGYDPFFDSPAVEEPGPIKYRLAEKGSMTGLESQERRVGKFERRHQEILNSYPDVDPERVNQILRSQPKLPDHDIALLARLTPEEADRVARGNLSASEREQIFKKASDAGQQRGLPGMGGGGPFDRVAETPETAKARQDLAKEKAVAPDKLEYIGSEDGLAYFNVNDPADPRHGSTLTIAEGENAPQVSKETLQKAFGPQARVMESTLIPGLHEVQLPNGKQILVRQNAEIQVAPEALTAYGKTELRPEEYVAGEWRTIDRGGMISLAKGEGAGILRHETFHGAMEMSLTEREKDAVLKQYGNEEAAARAYETWRPGEKPNSLFQKVMDFFRNLYRNFFPDAESVFGKVRSGEVWGRGAGAERSPFGGEAKFRVRREDESPDPLVNRQGFLRTGMFKVASNAQGMVDGLKRAAFPGTISEDHANEAAALASHLGTRQAEQAASQGKPLRRMFDKMGVGTRAENLEQNPGMTFASDYMQGKVQPGGPDGPLQKAADWIKAQFQDRADRFAAAGAPIEHLRENYFGTIWTPESRRAFNQAVGEAVAEGRGLEAMEGGEGGQPMDLNLWSAADKAWVKARVQEIMAQGGGSDSQNGAKYFGQARGFPGNESYRKPKVFDDIMTGVEFGLIPVSNNPIDLVQQKLHAMDTAITAYRYIQEKTNAGDMLNVNNSGRPLKKDMQADFNKGEWAKIPGRYGEIWTRDPESGLPMKVGERWARKPVVDVLDNYLSESLYRNPYIGRAFKGFMGLGNLLNQSQLASFFHAGFMSAEAQINAGAMVLKNVYGALRGTRAWGDVGQSLKQYPLAMVRGAYEGNQHLAEWANSSLRVPRDVPLNQLPETPEYKLAKVAAAAEEAGGGFIMDRRYMTGQTDKMMREWHGGQKLKAAMRSPVALLETFMKPVMEVMVPRWKAVVFADKALMIMDQNPGKTLTELRPEFRNAWNGVDATMGQVRYDRLFMRKSAQNAMQALFRAPGWTGGTIAWVGGAPIEGVNFFREWTKTGTLPKNLPDRVAYTVSLVGTVMLANAVLTYALTGKKPEGMDYVAFRTGEQDSKGRDVRFVLPTYMKDLFAYYENTPHTLIAKTHPLWSLVGNLIQNKDYFNNQVYDPMGGRAQKAADIGSFMVKQFEPFGVRGTRELLGATGEKGVGEYIAPQFGVMPASRAYTNTPAQNVIDEYNRLTRASTTTKETAEKKKLQADLLKMARDQDEAGFQEKAAEALKEGQITRQQVNELIKESQQPPGLNRFTKLPLEWSARVMEKASDYEKEQWTPHFLKKVGEAKPESLIKNREALVPLLEDMGYSEAAQTIGGLEISERGQQVNLSGLGEVRPREDVTAGAAGSTSTVDRLIADLIRKNVASLGEEKKKRSPFGGRLNLARNLKQELLAELGF